MTGCDVLIVGGGPAGSSCARGLTRQGIDVLVWDSRSFPRDKVCAGWITPQVIEALEIDVDDLRSGRTFQPIDSFITGTIGGREVETRYDRPVSYGIRRCEFDHYLLERSGARTRQGEPITSIERREGRWIINGEVEARLLVGAGGHFCPVARRLGARQGRSLSTVVAQEVEYEATAEDLRQGTIEPSRPELFFCEDLTGYGWCFRKANFLNIGLGRIDPARLAEHVAAFCDFLRVRGKLRGEIPKAFHGHAYQLYDHEPPRLVDEGVLLIGDAAGLAYPQSGEGIRPAVESGIIAAEVIAELAGDYRRERLDEYRQRVEARLGKPSTGGAGAWLPAAWLQTIAARLLASRMFAKHVVIERWFLHMHHPALKASAPVERELAHAG